MDLLLFAVLISAVAFWWTSSQIREHAVKLSRSACQRCHVQLLDETVTLSKMRLQRNEHGHINIARWYTFEFSTSGVDRRSGIVGLLGDKLTTMHLDLDIEEMPGPNP
ncbi:hypothetical protein AB833_16655 [Chromatiales bacterium (ex Bugula neritina AB1)]|nr:hypothetical protein AB833_16655 [Chromatiales bacterium (ex Bugula neritina AB1)]